MTQEFKAPSRRTLLVGAMLVALHGMEMEQILEARHFGYADWNQHNGVAHVRAAMAAVRAGKRFETSDVRILDLMAYTQQSLRVSYEEWESVQLIFPTAERERQRWEAMGINPEGAQAAVRAA